MNCTKCSGSGAQPATFHSNSTHPHILVDTTGKARVYLYSPKDIPAVLSVLNGTPKPCTHCSGTGKEPRRFDTPNTSSVWDRGQCIAHVVASYYTSAQHICDALEFYHRAGCPPVE